MPTLIDLRRRIQSIKNSQQVTQAMKTVATARYKKAHRLVVERRPFWHIYPELAISLTQGLGLIEHPYLQKRTEKKILVVVITSDKGLCGAFSSNLLDTAGVFLEKKRKGSEIKVIPIGKKAVNYFKRSPYQVEKAYFERVEKKIPEVSQDLSQWLNYQFVFQQIDAVYVLYNEFHSIIAPRITLTKLLPISAALEASAAPQVSYLQPDWEPEASRFIDYLLRIYLQNQIEHFLYESQAAEQASRMMAMENATRNAGDLISDLVLLLNKIRQASITRELLEIQTAVEALRQQGV
ncbi:MAG: ATP synthase F1 subunit gamma [Candidatus Aminicenantes bacterium]|nr:ATP synthase F1 subunit gamma [Candidatus Aminicenantes bacterium]